MPEIIGRTTHHLPPDPDPFGQTMLDPTHFPSMEEYFNDLSLHHENLKNFDNFI